MSSGSVVAAAVPLPTEALVPRALSAIAAAIDRVAVRAAKLVIDRTIMPGPTEVEQMRRQAAFYQSPDLVTDPARFFPFLDRPEPVPEVVSASLKPGPRGRARSRIVFPSPYRPVNPAFAAVYAHHVENHYAHADVWSHAGGLSRGTVVLLHGFGMGGTRLDAIALMAPMLFACGLDVVLFALPLHGPRSPRTARFSGQHFSTPDVACLNEAMAQAAHDLTALVAWVRSRSDAPIGVLGMSLGGYVAALMAGLTHDLAFVVPVVAPVCFGDLAHGFMGARARRPGVGGVLLDRDELRAAYRVHSPLTHPARVTRDRLFIMAARGDRIVPSEHPRRLEAHWRHPRTTWFTGGHLAPFGRRTMRVELRRFLRDVGVV